MKSAGLHTATAMAIHDVRAALQALSGAIELGILRCGLDGIGEPARDALDEVAAVADSIGSASGRIAADIVLKGAHEPDSSGTVALQLGSDQLDQLLAPIEVARVSLVARTATALCLMRDSGLSRDWVKRFESCAEQVNVAIMTLRRVILPVEAAALRPETLHVKQLLDSIAGTFALQAERKGVKVKVDSPDALSITCSRSLLATSLMNLVGNAVKYTDAGRVEVRATALDADGIVRIEVDDTGIGMDATTLSTLTQPYARGANALATSRPGEGLGLASADTAIRKLGGRLSFQSTVGSGTIASLEVPARVDDTDAVAKSLAS